MIIGSPTPYERDVLPFIRPFTDVLVSQVPAQGIHRHLDHGAGTGEVILQLERTHTILETVSLDPSPVMVARLREIFGHPITAPGRVVEVVHGTLASYLDNGPIEPFDLITSQLVLPFVPDPGGEL
jgi:trans-aconitate methyltransferase